MADTTFPCCSLDAAPVDDHACPAHREGRGVKGDSESESDGSSPSSTTAHTATTAV